MLKLPEAMLTALADHNDITYTAEVTLFGHNSVDITFTEDELVSGGCQLTRTNSSDTFPLGYIYCAQFTLQVVRTDELESTDFFNAEMVVHGVYEYDDQQFPFDLGTYTLLDISTKGEIIQMIGYDGVYAADMPVSDNLKALLPLPAKTVFENCCNYLGINFNAEYSYQNFLSAPLDWDYCDIVISSIPDGTTYRQVMSAVVVLFGANAYISPFDNHMYVVPIKLQESEQTLYNGGTFDSATPYASGDDLDGGTFEPWTTDVVTTFSDPINHPEFPLQNIVIDGVKASDGNFIYAPSGGTYLLTADISIYATGKRAIINRIGQRVTGLTFRPFTLDYRSYPFVDLQQKVRFEDSRLNTYDTILTHIDIMLKGITTIKCTAETPAQNNSKYASTAAKAEAAAAQARADAAEAKEDAQEALSQVDGAIDSVGLEMMRLNTLMANSMGMFETKVADPTTGAITYYLHNKETLATSDTIWKMTADGFAVSTDGGTTWTAGIDAQGRAVVNILSAIGIYADWIQTGQITNADGTGYWNLDTGEFVTTQDHDPTEQQQYPAYGKMEFKDGRLFLSLYEWVNPTVGQYEYQKTGSIELGVARYAYSISNSGYAYTAIPAFGGRMAFFEPNLSDTDYMGQQNAVIYFNPDGNSAMAPYGYTEYLLFLRTARFRHKVCFDNVIESTGAITTTGNVTGYGITATGGGIVNKSLADVGTTDVNAHALNIDGMSFTRSGTKVYVTQFHAPNTVFLFARAASPVYTAEYDGHTIVAMGTIKSTNAMYATAFNNTSDERKKNISEWDDRYDEIIDDLEPIIFTWKDEADDGRKHVGVSAQKTEKALHDRGITDSGIVTGGGKKTYTVAYNELTALLIRKVKQQQKQIDELSGRLSRLEQIVEEMAWR